jgi:hypothetical protein
LGVDDETVLVLLGQLSGGADDLTKPPSGAGQSNYEHGDDKW